MICTLFDCEAVRQCTSSEQSDIKLKFMLTLYIPSTVTDTFQIEELLT